MFFSASISSGLKYFSSGGSFSVAEESLEPFDEDKTDGTVKLYTGEMVLFRLTLLYGFVLGRLGGGRLGGFGLGKGLGGGRIGEFRDPHSGDGRLDGVRLGGGWASWVAH